jgi:DNA-binding response OmpR family regulator
MDVKVDGLELARKLRLHRNAVPILMLVARASAMDRIAGLNAGADYCLPKPFDTRELLASVHALLRRQGQQIDVLSFGNTELDLSAEMVSCNGRELRLSAREFDVLRLLMQTGDRNIPKETILARVWGYDSNAVENHVEVYVGFLRKKLRRIGSNMRIVAIRRVGYHLEETPCC